MHEKVKAWLAECGMTNLRLVNVIIGGKDHVGVAYHDQHKDDLIYVLGDHPAMFKKNGNKLWLKEKVCYRINAEERDWFVATYWNPPLQKSYLKQNVRNTDDKYHPFGHCFILKAWGTPDGTSIDHYERKPYDRKNIEVQPVFKRAA